MTKDEQFDELVMLITEGARPATEDADAILNAGYCKASEVAKEISDEIAKNLYRVKDIPNFVAIETTVLIEIFKKYKEDCNGRQN